MNMKPRRHQSRTDRALVAGIAILIATLCAGGSACAQTESSAAQRLQDGGKEQDRDQVARRLESVDTLIQRSSAARQIDASGDAGAKEKRRAAQSIYTQAQEAFKAADYARASKLLGEASSLMFQAVRTAEPEKVVDAKTRSDFDARKESVRALLAAQKRIASEKKEGDGEQTSRSIEKLMGEAQGLADAGKFVEGRSVLDRAYLAAKAAIASMRGGDTLVRTLSFANKAEEYRYELDRNDTHQLLIKVLLEDKHGEIDRMVNKLVDSARSLRSQAEAAASRGDHVKAIRLLEDSTGELVKAIRNAGIYIPG
jgi:hypothetical protein